VKKVLIYYRYFGKTLGGGEFLPLTVIAELQKTCEVTLALDWTDNVDCAVEVFGIPVDLPRLKLVKVMPKRFHNNQNGVLLSFYRFRRLKQLAKDADLCISMANIMDFGKPAHHFLITIDLGDAEFSEYVRNPAAVDPHRRRFSLKRLLGTALRHLLGMRTKREIIGNPEEHIYPNSRYTADLIRNFYGAFNGEVFYPPTIFEFPSEPVQRDPLKVVYLGRVTAAKRIGDIIEIVKLARERSGADITLSIAGHLGSKTYEEKLNRLTAGMDWVSFPGKLFGTQKADFLRSGSFAVHTTRQEAFGISITEYLKAGLIPIVPDEGGACEVVDSPELSFRNNDEAADILVRLLNDPDFRERQSRRCAERAGQFTKQVYQEKQTRLLHRLVEAAGSEKKS